MEIGGKVLWFPFGTYSNIFSKKIHWSWTLMTSHHEAVKELSLLLLQRFIQQILIGHLLCKQHGASVWVYHGKQNRKSHCLLRGASDRIKVSLILEHNRGHLSNPTGWWHPKGHSGDHLGHWDKSRERAGLNCVNSSRRNCFQVTPHLAYTHEAMQK